MFPGSRMATRFSKMPCEGENITALVKKPAAPIEKNKGRLKHLCCRKSPVL